ncbi:MAG: TM2 domain-containing protein [Lentisphaerae bacterium]|nr:TM2 domain-containing protein [Lentisphaerota bacterium]
MKSRAPSAAPRAAASTPASTAPKSEPVAPADNASEKSRLVALLLCFFLGPIGVHRFYVGKVGTGIVQILTFGGLGIWVLIDFIMIIVGAFSDKKGLPLQNW